TVALRRCEHRQQQWSRTYRSDVGNRHLHPNRSIRCGFLVNPKTGNDMPMTSQYRQSALRSRKGNEVQRGWLRLSVIQKFRERSFLLALVSWLCVSAPMCSVAQTAKLQKDATGINITGAATPFHAGF